jgi:type II secretory pathway component PulM
VRELEEQLRRLEHRERLMSLALGAMLVMTFVWWWTLT